jgi:hypothetical protein
MNETKSSSPIYPESLKLSTLIYYRMISDADEFPLRNLAVVKLSLTICIFKRLCVNVTTVRNAPNFATGAYINIDSGMQSTYLCYALCVAFINFVLKFYFNISLCGFRL